MASNNYAKYSGLGGSSGGGSAGVTSLNSLTGALTLVAGSGVSITPSGNNLTITATGSGGGSVTSVSVVSANGLGGTVANASTTPALTLTTSVTGLVKGNGTGFSAATAGTDYSAGTSALSTGLLKSTTSTGALTIATAGTDYQAPGNYITALTGDATASGPGSAALTLATVNANVGTFNTLTVNAKGLVTAASNTSYQTPITLTTTGSSGAATFSGGTLNIPNYASGSGTVTSVSVASANGFAGTVATATTTPAITVSTTITGLLKGNGTAISAATAGTDYVVPSGSITGTASNITATSNSTLTTLSALSLPYSQLTGAPTFSTLSPQTTKGDIITYSTTPVRHAVPADYGYLIADSQQTDGYRNAIYYQTQGKPGKNYIQYADFENTSTTGWTLGTTGALTNGLPTATPTFGSGAAGTLSISTTTSAIGGLNSLSFSSSAATTVGNMVASSAYAIDTVDQAKVLTVKFSYLAATNPGNGNFSGTSSNTFAWAIWDVTNAGWIPGAGNFNLTQTTGAGYCTGTFQTASNTAQIRLVIYCANASTGSIALTLDDFYVGPQTSPMAPAVRDATSYTMTIGATTTAPTKGTTIEDLATWSRNGDKMIVTYNYYQNAAGSGAAGSGVYLFPLPSGYTIDTTKAYAGAGNFGTNGVGVGNVFAGTSYGATVNVYDTTHLSLAANGAQVGSSNLSLAGANVQIGFTAIIPIAGWSSNSVASSDTDTRVIDFIGSNTSNQSLTANVTNLIFPTVTKDSAGAYSAGVYTIPVTGDYWIAGCAQDSATTSASYYVYQNTVKGQFLFKTVSGQLVSGGALTTCKAGDTISVRGDSTTTIAPPIQLSINRLQGPAVITATESVNGSYADTSAGTIGTSSATYTFATKVRDTHNAYSAGTLTIPVSGEYRFTSQMQTAAVTLSTTQAFKITVSRNGTVIGGGATAGTGGSNNYSAIVSVAYPCNAGDLITISTTSSVATTATTLAGWNTFCWERVGN